MAECSAAGDDLHDLFSLLDEGFLDNDCEFNLEIDAVVSEISMVSIDDQSFVCTLCKKVYKTKRGLIRHTKTKHAAECSSTNNAPPSEKLTTLKLKNIIEKSAVIVSSDLCLPSSKRLLFENFSLSDEELDVLIVKLKPVVNKFSGDREKFYAEFYGLLIKNLLPSKFDNISISNILMTEVANHILVYLLNDEEHTTSPSLYSSKQVNGISDKENKCLQYISGYIVRKLHNKFRMSDGYKSNEFNIQCVSILKSVKIESDESQTLVNARDRGGLWRVNRNMQEIFLQCECIFRSQTSHFSTKLVCSELVDAMLKNSVILSNYRSICHAIEPKVSKEISFNLLEQMLTLFVRVRTFSFAKDIREKHKAIKRSVKKRSLRTEIKQSSSSTEGGH